MCHLHQNFMPSIRVLEHLNNGMYYLTFTIHMWYYILDRNERWSILSSSLKYCIENKNLKLHCFVFMINHIHLIVSSEDIAGIIRDFKKFTSKQIRKNIEITEPNLLKLFQKKDNDEFHLWEDTNMPVNIETQKFFLQKQKYIHLNPVKRHYVMLPEHWYWSSANENCELKVSLPWE